MRALVTGAAGFVGRHAFAELKRRGWSVSRADLVYGVDALDVFAEDLTSYDLVVHAAASSPHRAAIDGQAEHFARNVQLDAAMFEWAVRTGQGRVLYLSSSAAYPAAYQDWSWTGSTLAEGDVRLDRVMQPDANYGWTKLTGEMLAAAARSKGVPVTVVRPFSGYGEDQTEDFPFRAILERVKRREDPLTIWGNGNQVRDWIHIDDVVAGMLAVAESGTEDPVNLCTGVATSMVELATLACLQVHHMPDIALLPDRPAGVAHRVGDPTRFHEFYKPQVSLVEGIARCLEE